MTLRESFRRKIWGGHLPHYSATDEELMRQATNRVRKLSTTQILEWADAAGSGMAKGFQDYREHGDISSLEDIGLGVISLQAVVMELKARAAAERS